MTARDDFYDAAAAADMLEDEGHRHLAKNIRKALDLIDAQQATIARLTRECKAWMNGVADAVEPLGYDRAAACGPSDLLPGLDTLTKLRLAVVDQCIDDYMRTPNQGRGADLAITEGDDGHRHVADAGMGVLVGAVDGPVRQEHGGGASEPKPAQEGERASDPPAADPHSLTRHDLAAQLRAVGFHGYAEVATEIQHPRRGFKGFPGHRTLKEQRDLVRQMLHWIAILARQDVACPHVATDPDEGTSYCTLNGRASDGGDL